MSNIDNRTLWVDYLRSFITVLVVAHHASLAYTTFARFDTNTYINSTHVIVDSNRWIGLDIFQNFNDVFFMSLMFLIGGFFLFKSLSSKGIATFIKDRFYRLFVPFLLGGTFLMLLSYYPSYILATGDINILSYVRDFFIHQRWPVGPPWFIWLLFAFNIILGIFYPILKRLLARFNIFIVFLVEKPFFLISVLALFTWVLYVPLAYNIGAGTWTGIGPFDFQLSRILLYFGYFFLGAMIGGSDSLDTLFSEQSELVRKWPLWVILSISFYIILTVIPSHLIAAMENNNLKVLYGWMIYYAVYVLSCVFSCIAFLTIFKALVHSEKSWWNSLSKNAYLIYMLHFVFIVWLQFLLLDISTSAFTKFIIVFIVSLVFSWSISILLRKIPIINKYL